MNCSTNWCHRMKGFKSEDCEYGPNIRANDTRSSPNLESWFDPYITFYTISRDRARFASSDKLVLDPPSEAVGLGMRITIMQSYLTIFSWELINNTDFQDMRFYRKNAAWTCNKRWWINILKSILRLNRMQETHSLLGLVILWWSRFLDTDFRLS
jgi:hypothetical protein